MRRAGFTLLEATVALVIVGIVAIGALEAFAVEADAARRARQAAPAAAVAAERLAQLQLLDARGLQSLPDSLHNGRVADGSRMYEWTSSAAPVRDERDLYTVRVDVRWETGTYALATRVFRRPLETLR
jgi:type II secretion system protein I